MSEPPATLILSLAIKKRRSLLQHKERDFRKELLIGNTISRLCKHIGEQRARRKRPAATIDCESTPGSSTENNKAMSENELPSSGLSNGPATPRSRLNSEPPVASHEPLVARPCRRRHRKRSHSASPRTASKLNNQDSGRLSSATADPNSTNTDDYDESDPFGLNAFFDSLRQCVPSPKSGTPRKVSRLTPPPPAEDQSRSPMHEQQPRAIDCQ